MAARAWPHAWFGEKLLSRGRGWIVNVLGSFIIGFFATLTGRTGRRVGSTGTHRHARFLRRLPFSSLESGHDGGWRVAARRHVGRRVVLCLFTVSIGSLLAASLNSSEWSLRTRTCNSPGTPCCSTSIRRRRRGQRFALARSHPAEGARRRAGLAAPPCCAGSPDSATPSRIHTTKILRVFTPVRGGGQSNWKEKMQPPSCLCSTR